MKATRVIVMISLAVLLAVSAAQAQSSDANTKHFIKDGLVFDYPNAWSLTDESNADAQKLTIVRSDSDAQIRIFVHRGKIDTPEKMATAKRALVDPYIASTNKSFEQMGAKPESTPAGTEIGGAKADGVRLRASLSGEPGEAAIYWLAVGNRMVVMTFFGPDSALKKAANAWDAVRNSLQIVDTKPPQKTAPK